MSTIQTIITLLVIALATQITRFLPFIIFRKQEKSSPFISYLATVLPLTVLGILVVYCLKDLTFSQPQKIINNILAITIIVVLHLWKRKVLLSILAGTLCYIILICLFP